MKSLSTVSLKSFILQGNERMPTFVILHGLFGSKQNWQSLSKALARETSCSIHVLDLRNHGDSPHHEEMTYETMAKDVLTYMSIHQVQQPILVGHSMGGKVALATALLSPSTVKGVVSVDMTPLQGGISSLFEHFIKAMMLLNETRPKRLSEANEFLAKYIEDLAVRQFLLTNLKPSQTTNSLQFRIPLSMIEKNLKNLSSFLEVPKHQTYAGPVLIVGAQKANYVHESMLPEIQTHFPKAQIEMMNTGHWIHAEQPLLLLEKIKTMLPKIV